MGHSRIGTLPATKGWKEVVRLVSNGADEARIDCRRGEESRINTYNVRGKDTRVLYGDWPNAHPLPANGSVPTVAHPQP